MVFLIFSPFVFVSVVLSVFVPAAKVLASSFIWLVDVVTS